MLRSPIPLGGHNQALDSFRDLKDGLAKGQTLEQIHDGEFDPGSG